MIVLTGVINYLLPFLCLVFLLLGLSKNLLNYILIALWLSLVALLISYHGAGGEIFGTYFNYKNALLYSLNIVIAVIAFLYVCFNVSSFQGKYVRYLIGFIAALVITGSALLLINLWINARFVESRLPGTALMEVVTFTPAEYCNNRFVFYKIGSNGKVSYLCPNHYGLIPSVGNLDTPPEFIIRQLNRPVEIEKLTPKKDKN
ncbi:MULTISPECIES: type I secretion system protein LssZ [Legionella]|uniref:Type I secretion system protein LssZ n=1 Tax=Legionella septentrionalis TaxID=2498109 RepID=A0A433JIS1_9GAMM|nr:MULTISPECIES: type I secretion system protein LssZ [Legionella]MCP0913290.1 type I secretion system protein LssZ [Legionella sp. 27cVA30]RUQ85208.1 type I secretion system protein LssZ [Legionella septentrionalis]RUQ97972.1 type I secretion system protein LssZ [Legionella septentrionalis]RUR08834.1 type I secretion system protein LssZ [Legionella septentrionalis]RUR14652.1 type I secretion system protein LssZ [Legionella septentrionalis]